MSIRLGLFSLVFAFVGLTAGCDSKGGSGKPCRADAECKTGLACKPTPGTNAQSFCVLKAEADAVCKEHASCTGRGACSAKNSECVVTSSEGCQASTICKHDGKCTFKDADCVIGSDQDCAQSYTCKVEGNCVAKSGECVTKE